MSVTVGGLSNVQAQFNQTPATGPFAGTTVALPPVRFQCNFTNGTTSDKIDGLGYENLTFVASTPQSIDMSALTDAFNNSVTNAHTAYLAIKVVAADGAYLTVGNAGSNEWDGCISSGGTIKVYPGSANNDGFVIFSFPGTTIPAVDSTHKMLKLDPGANAMTVTLLAGTRSV